MLNDKLTKGKGIASEIPTGALAIVLPLDYSAVASNTSTKNLVVTGHIFVTRPKHGRESHGPEAFACVITV